MTNLAIDPFNNYRGNRRSNAVRERERRRQFLPHHFRKPSISNQDKVLILVDYFCRLNGGPTYCVKSPVLVCLFQDFTVYTRG